MRRTTSALLLSVVVACSSEKHAPTRASVTPASVSAAQFAGLTWLEGRWRGAEANGTPFYESYASRTPTVIATYNFQDSTFGTPSDSGQLTLRGDTLFSGSSTVQWVAVAIDSLRVEFAPWRGASNHFVWERGAGQRWTATLRWDSAGTAKQRQYEMRRVE